MAQAKSMVPEQKPTATPATPAAAGQAVPPLGYEYNALEPFIDEQTMRIHHDKHHQAYVDKLNAALASHKELQGKPAWQLLMDLEKIPADIKNAVRNHGGGHFNHSLFWAILKKGTSPKGDIAADIAKKWGTLDKFKEEFSNAAIGQFGSGWAWLVVNKGALEIVALPNQDSPVSQGKTPILGVDVWEHAYYLKYQNKRADYVAAFWNVVNWDEVEKGYKRAKGK